MFDIEAAYQKVVKHLLTIGFTPRDADISDFADSHRPDRRFKVGTSYGEVAVTVWDQKRQIGVIRATTEANLSEALDQIDWWLL